MRNGLLMEYAYMVSLNTDRSRSYGVAIFHVVSSAAPSLLSFAPSFTGSFAMTFSNCDHSPSTWLNSLPTWSRQ